MKPIRTTMPALAAAMMLAGCTHSANERLTIGTVATPSFGGPGGPGMSGGEPRPRRSWTTRLDIAPIDGVVHSGTLRTPEPVGRRSDAATVGAYPDPTLLPPDDDGNAAWPALQSLGRATGEVILMPIRGPVGLVADDRAWSPAELWKRAPASAVREGTVGASQDPASGPDAEPRHE